MDYSGDLIVVELKRDMTPREVTAQAIDYASCMAELKLEEVAELYSRYSGDTKSLNEAYESKYHVELNDESLNCNVRMVIVASQMDTSTERIIKYLREKYGVPINILFFDVYPSIFCSLMFLNAMESVLSVAFGLMKKCLTRFRRIMRAINGIKSTMCHLAKGNGIGRMRENMVLYLLVEELGIQIL